MNTSSLLQKLLPALLLSAFTSTASFGQIVLIQNNFDSMPVNSTYNGTTGQSLGSAILGNATGNRNSQRVTGNGTGATPTNAFFHDQDLAIRSSSTANATLTTTFSIMFYYDPDTTNANGMLFAGWATANATDNQSPYNFASGVNRVGLTVYRTLSSHTVTIRHAGDMANSSTTNQTSSGNLTVGNWYRFGFDMTYNYTGTRSTSSITYQDIRLEDWGTNGASLLSTLISANMTQAVPTTPTSGIGTYVFDNVGSVYAFVAGNDDRGVYLIDNLSVTQIPEPQTWALLAAALGAMVIFRRRRMS